MIRCTDVHMRFREKRVLDGLEIVIEDNKSTVIMGRSGIGKSVLLKCICGLLTPQQGVIEIDGQNIAAARPRQAKIIRSAIGMLLQEGALFDGLTVYENIAFPLTYHRKHTHAEIDREVRRYADIVEMTPFLNVVPRELSGGMKRKAALARCMITHPRYLFYDEPTTGLDPISAGTVDAIIKKLSDTVNITSLIVTHDVELALFVGDTVALIEDGRIRALEARAEFKRPESELRTRFIDQRRILHEEYHANRK